MQLIDSSWQERVHLGVESDRPMCGLAAQSPLSIIPGQTEGMRYRRYLRAWSVNSHTSPARSSAPRLTADGSPATSEEVLVQAVSGLISEWPRVLQIASICVAFSAAIFAAAHIVSTAGGLAICFFFLAAVFFGNFAAYRRGLSAWLVGPTIAVLGTWGCLIITAGIGVNALVGA